MTRIALNNYYYYYFYWMSQNSHSLFSLTLPPLVERNTVYKGHEVSS